MRRDPLRRHGLVASGLVAIVVAMTGLTFASVPLYRLFCQATGFGGTTQRVEAASPTQADRVITVRFNTDVAPDLPWSFQPEVKSIRVRLGESKLVVFKATNRATVPLVGRAVYNVTPDKAGLYFDKIQCFCFDEQRIEAGRTAELPVTFFVDPDIAKDAGARDLDTITLSYTFFRDKPSVASLSTGRTQ